MTVDAVVTPAEDRARHQRWLVRWVDRPLVAVWRPFHVVAEWLFHDAFRGIARWVEVHTRRRTRRG